MRFPSITHYVEAVANIEDRLRTRKDIKPMFDKQGHPLYYAAKGVVSFVVEIQGRVVSLKCFTSVSGYDRVNDYSKAGIMKGEMLEYEIFVFDDNQEGDYYTVFIEDRSVEVASETVQEYREGLIPFLLDGLWGYMDVESKVVIEPMYDSVTAFSEGRAVVERKGMYGLVDTTGHLVLNTTFDEVSWDGSAIAYCERSGHWGCYDRSGRMIADCVYDWMGEFSSSLLLVKQNSRYGFLNLLGEVAIPLVYDSATSFDENGLSNVTFMGRSVMINTNGDIDKA